MTTYRNRTRYAHIETVDGLHRPHQPVRLDIPTEDDIRPALWRGILIGLALVSPAWLMFALAWFRFGLGGTP